MKKPFPVSYYIIAFIIWLPMGVGFSYLAAVSLPLMPPAPQIAAKPTKAMSPKLAASIRSQSTIKQAPVFGPHKIIWSIVASTNDPVAGTVLSGSVDLTNWQVLATNSAAIGNYSYTDPSTNAYRFYRLVVIGSYNIIDTLTFSNP